MAYRVIVDPHAAVGYEFRGDNRRAFACRDQSFVLAGAADTGKTVTCCVKLHTACLTYPGSQHAILRKTFASMSGSVLQTFGRIIKGAPVRTMGGDKPTKYTYTNGSVVWVGGLDNPERALSSERDSIYVNQAEELVAHDWETISTRCTGRAAVMPYAQLYGDCNPGGSRHWIREKAARGDLTLFTARHRDNPTIYDPKGNVLPGSEPRLAALMKLTGVRRKRLFEGIWATAEGAVYDTFDASVHVRARSPKEMHRWFLAMDEGFTNPAVILIVGEDSDGRWHVFKEFYFSGILQASVVSTALAWFVRPQWAVVGKREEEILNAHRRRHLLTPEQARLEAAIIRPCELAAVDEAAAGLIADLVAAGVWARGGKGRVIDGINRIQNRLAIAGDGNPRLTFDPSCINCINEFESYVWEPDKPKDTPRKEHDHTSDALRYLDNVLSEPTGAWSPRDVAAASTGHELPVGEPEALDPYGAELEIDT